MAGGIYEKSPGSGVWWIRYVDAKGAFHEFSKGLLGPIPWAIAN
jgi:hypothetical protein